MRMECDEQRWMDSGQCRSEWERQRDGELYSSSESGLRFKSGNADGSGNNLYSKSRRWIGKFYDFAGITDAWIWIGDWKCNGECIIGRLQLEREQWSRLGDDHCRSEWERQRDGELFCDG